MTFKQSSLWPELSSPTLFRILGGSPDHEINSSRRRTGFLFSNNATHTQGQGRNNKKQARIKWVLAGTMKEPAGANRDKQGQKETIFDVHSLLVQYWRCLSLLVLFIVSAYPNHVTAIPHLGVLLYFLSTRIVALVIIGYFITNILDC